MPSNTPEQNRKLSEYRKKTNYASEKKPQARADRSIKRATRSKYPLEGQKCVRCHKNAEERHHTTDPIHVDWFVFVCKKHHVEIHRELRQHIRVLKLQFKTNKQTNKTFKKDWCVLLTQGKNSTIKAKKEGRR